VGRSVRVLATLAVVAATLAGCLDANPPSALPSPTRQPEPTPTTTTYSLGTTVWYEGLELHFDTVTAVLDARGGPVEVRLRLDNPTDDVVQLHLVDPTEEAGVLDGKIRLVVGGTAVEATRESIVPDVPAKGSASATLTYELQGIASIDDAVIEIGAAPLHVARVPITAAAGVPLTFEPVELHVGGSGTAASLKITLRSAVMRWDLPDWSQELDAKTRALTLTYDVTYAGDFSGGLSFKGELVALRLPDGTIVERRRDGHNDDVALVGPRKTKKDLVSRFEIPEGVTGSFALLARNGSVIKAIKFTIKG
jgi:hypothetical protein